MFAAHLAPAALVLTPRAAPVQEAEEPLVNQSDGPFLRAFAWRSVVPFGHGGRVDDLAVHPGDPHTDFVGFATGGLWKPANNGSTPVRCGVVMRYGSGKRRANPIALGDAFLASCVTGDGNR